MILRILNTHAPQVVHERIRRCFSNNRLTASTQDSSKTEPRTVMSENLNNPDSQSDTQEAIQSERTKGTPLIQPS